MTTAALTTTTRITPEQFLELPDQEKYELVNGELVEMPVMSLEGAAIGNRLGARLQAFVDAADLGVVLNSEATYQCFLDDPSRVRKPDVSFIRRGRLPADQYEHGHCRIVPDLAVEIVSPNDVMFDVEEKILEYLAAGVGLVWMISPKSRSLMAYHSHGKRVPYDFDEFVTGENVLPGFRFQVLELFPAFDGAR